MWAVRPIKFDRSLDFSLYIISHLMIFSSISLVIFSSNSLYILAAWVSIIKFLSSKMADQYGTYSSYFDPNSQMCLNQLSSFLKDNSYINVFWVKAEVPEARDDQTWSVGACWDPFWPCWGSRERWKSELRSGRGIRGGASRWWPYG